MENIVNYKYTIQQKLNILDKKFRLSAKTCKNEEKLSELYRYIKKIEDISLKLDQNYLVWKDLEDIGITYNSIVSVYREKEFERSVPESFEDFDLLGEIPIKELLVETDSIHIHINKLYSIINYMNDNYQSIFTQKILMSASKTNNIREQFYMQYQNILHIFKSYKHLDSINVNSSDHEQLLKKEYIQLLKSIHYFFTGIQEYIELIKKDPTFTSDDFNQPIKSTDTTISIYELPLNIALDECNIFITEALTFITNENKDIFDYLSLDS